VVIWYILWSFGTFCGHWVYFVVIWYILWSFGIFPALAAVCVRGAFYQNVLIRFDATLAEEGHFLQESIVAAAGRLLEHLHLAIQVAQVRGANLLRTKHTYTCRE
jgi:hypothetical protein